MKPLKYSVILIAGLIVTATVYGQTLGKAKTQISRPVIAAHPISVIHKPSVPTSSTGGISALPLTGRGLAERDAAYAPSDAFRKQAMSLYAAGDLTSAEAACINALNAAPTVAGQPQHVPFAAELLGQIYLKDGQYEKAVQWLKTARPNTAGSSVDLNLALAYVRLGDYNHAQEFYSDEATLRYYPQGDLQELPGTDSPNNLEASILLARSLDAYLEHRYDDALPDLQRANKLAPTNALIAYHCAQILNEKGRYSEALPLYETAATTGRGVIGEEAKRRSVATRSTIAMTKESPQQ